MKGKKKAAFGGRWRRNLGAFHGRHKGRSALLRLSERSVVVIFITRGKNQLHHTSFVCNCPCLVGDVLRRDGDSVGHDRSRHQHGRKAKKVDNNRSYEKVLVETVSSQEEVWMGA